MMTFQRPAVKIGAEFDLHAHPTPALLQACDVMIYYKEYPHTDFRVRARELFNICVAAARGEVEPEMFTFNTRTTSTFTTTQEPMRSYVNKLIAAEDYADGGAVLSASLVSVF